MDLLLVLEMCIVFEEAWGCGRLFADEVVKVERSFALVSS